jgi:hypothetical protein
VGLRTLGLRVPTVPSADRKFARASAIAVTRSAAADQIRSILNADVLAALFSEGYFCAPRESAESSLVFGTFREGTPEFRESGTILTISNIGRTKPGGLSKFASIAAGSRIMGDNTNLHGCEPLIDEGVVQVELNGEELLMSGDGRTLHPARICEVKLGRRGRYLSPSENSKK